MISSAKAVKELMDRNTGNSVDRPPLYWADQITGGLHLATVRYGKSKCLSLAFTMMFTDHTVLRRHMALYEENRPYYPHATGC